MILWRWINDFMDLSNPIKLNNTRMNFTMQKFIKINQDIQKNPGIMQIMTNKFNYITNI